MNHAAILKIKEIDEQNNPFEGVKFNFYPLKEFELSQSFQRKRIATEYLKEAKDFIGRVKSGLYLYDYLERFSEEKSFNKEKYIEIHNNIFSEIENLLHDGSDYYKPKIKYARFLAVPIKTFDYIKKEIEEPKFNVAKKVIDICGLPLFKHICYCLNKYPQYNYGEVRANDTDNYYGGFYLITYPTRTNFYAYINDGECCVTEYNRYTREGACKPDLLIVEEDNNSVVKLIDIYRSEINKLLYNSRKLKRKDIDEVIRHYKKENNLDLFRKELDNISESINQADSVLKIELLKQKKGIQNKIQQVELNREKIEFYDNFSWSKTSR